MSNSEGISIDDEAGLLASEGRHTSPKDANLRVARAWLDAFNRHDVDALVALYADDCTHTSPKIRALRPDTAGQLRGKAALAAWWRDSNARLANLRYVETAITADDQRVVIEYLRHAPDGLSYVSQSFDVADGRITASRVYHG